MLAVLPGNTAPTADVPAPSGISRTSSWALTPELFYENLGQVGNSDVILYSSTQGVSFGRGSVTLHSAVPDRGLHSSVQLTFPGAHCVTPAGLDMISRNTSYFLGNDRSGWRTGVAGFRSVVYEGLWDGIDLAYFAGRGDLKYEFTVHPGADPSMIRVRLRGHDDLALTGAGALSIGTGLGPGTEIVDSGLDVFYGDDPSEKIAAGFKLLGDDTYSFSLGAHDSSRPVVIDPLIHSTFLGGSGSDHAEGVATDTQGNSYIVGQTTSPDFPTTPGVFETDYFGYAYDIFVAKVNRTGDTLLYSTYLGDVGADHAMSIAVDGAGNAYITGYTKSFGFPTTPGALDRTYNGDTYDGFVTKLGPLGDTLVYSTFIGGSRVDMCYGIDVDDNGYAYVTGNTWSYDFPITPNAMNRVFNGGQPGANDAFVTKLSQAGDAVVYSSFLGHSDYDYGTGIAVDASGCAHVVGYTRSIGYPTTPGAFSRTHNGGYEAFVTKMSRSGSAYVYSTFLGGTSSDFGQSIALGRWGDAYITGYTHSTDFPTTPGAHSSTNSGWYDVFVSALNPYGTSLLYSTYLGGEGSDYAYGITLDNQGCAQVTGQTASADFPTTQQANDRTHNGNSDAFVVKLSYSGDSLSYSSYLGGEENDVGKAIAIDSNAYTIVVGDTSSPDFPTVPGSIDPLFNGMTDVFITSMDLADPVADAGPDRDIDEDSVADFNGGGSRDNHGIANYTWTFHDGAGNVTLNGVTASHRFQIPGIYEVALNVTDTSGNWGLDTMTLTVLDTTLPVADAGPDRDIEEGMVVTFNGSASTDNVGIANQTWSFKYGGADVILCGAVRAFAFEIPGYYRVTLTVVDAAGNADTDTVNVTVRDITPPVARAGRDSSVRAGSEFRFNGSASADNVGIAAYAWSFNDGSRSVVLHGMMPTHLFEVVGVYSVLLNVTDTAGHWDTDTMILEVLEIVDPAADAGPDQTVDEGASMRFDGSASTDNVGVVCWEWSFNDGANDVTLFGVSPAWTFTVPGTYAVTLNASDAAGNRDTDTMHVIVRDVTDPVPVPGPNRVVSPGSTVTLDGSGSADSSGIVNHAWTFTHNGTTQELDGPVQTFTFWTPGDYTVTLTVTDGAGNTASGSMTVRVLSEPVPEHQLFEYFPALAITLSLVILAVALYIHFSRGGRAE